MKRKNIGIGAVVSIFIIVLIISSATAIPVTNSCILKSRFNSVFSSKKKESLIKILDEINQNNLFKNKRQIFQAEKNLKIFNLDNNDFEKIMWLSDGFFLLLAWLNIILKCDKVNLYAWYLLDWVTVEWINSGHKEGYLRSGWVEPTNPELVEKIYNITFWITGIILLKWIIRDLVTIKSFSKKVILLTFFCDVILREIGFAYGFINID